LIPHRPIPKNIYETDALRSQYLLFHYGKKSDILPFASGPMDALDFHRRCVNLLRKHVSLGPESIGLDLGCAVGRATFELARFCPDVVGIDYSAQFIKIATHLQKKGFIEFNKINEGRWGEKTRVCVPSGIDRRRVRFLKGDACRLSSKIGIFDAALLLNLIDRLSDPQLCLLGLSPLIKSGGTVLISSPYTWLEDFTPKKKWLGGFVAKGKLMKTIDTLKRILGVHFEFVGSHDVPFIIREHQRKFQWSVAQVSLWRKRRDNR